jgi:hypothetical protein
MAGILEDIRPAKFKIAGPLQYLGWATAAAMGLSVVVLIMTQFI